MHSLTSSNLVLQFPPLLPRKFPHRTEPMLSNRMKPRKGLLKDPIFFTTLNSIHAPDNLIRSNFQEDSCSTINQTGIPFSPTLTVAEKVHFLASEFRSLSEPIERVKRLLHYATLLPPLDESARVEENRVTGCTTMVWLKVEMDSDKLMRFGVDSDSVITKGFCSCLIWLFDGAVPEEVLSVNCDHLMDMNVGLMPSKGPSRVNTWHNVFSSMQKRTKSFIEFRDSKDRSLTRFPPSVASPDAINGSFKEAQNQM
ncbi:OLC1v1028444C1 [Oldenlandia corymbosa var. corymbosa]|uniref:OLC1v1028444C1 n=1 Tax=Oldenlandia corymbosa var. corymbosa TaxID=529605 RepID=A0AAV1CEL1_OLDCO|nr:OLC1v1028444C1 [Oldenlandia corymbosa var. corymbosa]